MSDLTLIVPTFNRPHALARCLEALQGQQGLQQTPEIIVVDDGSENPPRIPPGVRCLRQPNRGPAAARNRGIEAAHGELLLFTDDDCIPAPGWAARMRDFMETHPHLDGAAGEVRNLDPRHRYARVNQDIIDAIREAGEREGRGVTFGTTNNMVYRRRLFSTGLRFDERFRGAGGEERELHARVALLGRQIGHCAEAVVFHDHAPDFRGFLTQQFSYGRGAERTSDAHPNRNDVGWRALLPLAARTALSHPGDLPALVASQAAVLAGRVRQRFDRD